MFRMMRFAAVIAFAAGMAACEAQCSVSSAGLSEESMANAVNQETKAPVAMVTSFAPDASVIYASAKLSNAPVLRKSSSRPVFSISNSVRKMSSILRVISSFVIGFLSQGVFV